MIVEFLTPEKVSTFKNASYISLVTKFGELGVMDGHEKTILMLKAGIVKITENNVTSEYFITSGFAEINSDKSVLLIEEAIEKNLLSNDYLERKKLEFKGISDKHPEYENKLDVINSLNELLV